MRSTEVLKLLAEKPELLEGGHFLLRASEGRFQERVRISKGVYSYLQRNSDCDFMVLSREDLQCVSWKS